MDMLQAFLDADLNIEASVELKRLGGALNLKAVDGKTIGKLQDQATHYVGKGSKREAQLDEQKFGALIIAEACTNMNFADQKLLEKYSASDAADCVQKSLLAGEIARVTKAVMDVSGFEDVNEQVEKAKN